MLQIVGLEADTSNQDKNKNRKEKEKQKDNFKMNWCYIKWNETNFVPVV